jgi:hypothetical protein
MIGALGNLPLDALLCELRLRVQKLQRDAQQTGSAQSLNAIAQQLYEAGVNAGVAESARAFAAGLDAVLERATAEFDADASKADGQPQCQLDAWRNGRRNLWKLVTELRDAALADASKGTREAKEAHAKAQAALREVLADTWRRRVSRVLRSRIERWEVAR